MEKREPVLSMRDLAVSFQASFGKIRAVRGVNMDVYPGAVSYTHLRFLGTGTLSFVCPCWLCLYHPTT